MKRDQEGYLINLDDWNIQFAETLAKEMQLTLTQDHWHIIHFVRGFYLDYHTTPTMRALIKAMRTEIDEAKLSSVYIQSLFPEGAAKQIAKLAGLPKPTKCI